MRPGFRRFLAVGAMVVGAGLLGLELSRPPGTSFERVFWLAVAGLVMIFGLVESITIRLGRDEPPTLE